MRRKLSLTVLKSLALGALVSPVAISASFASDCLASNPSPGETHDRLRKSLVFLHASAVNKDNGKEERSEATGFLVNKTGEILTVYHFYRKLGNFKVETLRIEASLRGKEAARREVVAAPIGQDLYHDLLKLRIRDVGDIPANDLQPVCFVSVGELEHWRDAKQLLGMDAMTSGFPRNVPYISDQGTIAALEGKTHHWTVTKVVFVEGQSGSPIYTRDGRVFALVKGSDDDVQSHQYIIPISRAYLLEPRLWEAQRAWELGQQGNQKASETGQTAAVKLEQMRLCQQAETLSSAAVLRVLLKDHEGTTAGECLRARLQEITGKQTETIKPIWPTGQRTISDAQPDERARNMVEQIAGLVGVPVRFKVRLTSDVDSASAAIDGSGGRFLLINPEFFEQMEKVSNWGAMVVIAHELGHHLALHNLGGDHAPERRRQMELEADHFAGFALARLGASLDEAQVIFKALPDLGTTTHPDRASRLGAVEKGWRSAR